MTLGRTIKVLLVALGIGTVSGGCIGLPPKVRDLESEMDVTPEKIKAREVANPKAAVANLVSEMAAWYERDVAGDSALNIDGDIASDCGSDRNLAYFIVKIAELAKNPRVSADAEAAAAEMGFPVFCHSDNPLFLGNRKDQSHRMFLHQCR